MPVLQSRNAAECDTETIGVPAGVEITDILVEYGDVVETDDLLAVVDMATVRTGRDITDKRDLPVYHKAEYGDGYAV